MKYQNLLKVKKYNHGSDYGQHKSQGNEIFATSPVYSHLISTLLKHFQKYIVLFWWLGVTQSRTWLERLSTNLMTWVLKAKILFWLWTERWMREGLNPLSLSFFKGITSQGMKMPVKLKTAVSASSSLGFR